MPRPCLCLRLAVTLAAAAVLAGACSGGGGAAPTAPGEPSAALVEFDSFTLVNAARVSNAVQPPLELREAISQVAREHSRHMRDQGFFDHTDRQGRTVMERLQEAGIGFATAGENLAMTVHIANPAGWAHDQLMQSAEHRANLLNPHFQFVGVGVAKDGDRYWITQVFVGQ
jgi:uncharacterized protein YkwD